MNERRCQKPRCRYVASWFATQMVGTQIDSMYLCDIHKLWALIIAQPRITWYSLKREAV